MTDPSVHPSEPLAFVDRPTGAASVGVKICGVRTAEDARLVIEAGADAIGVNFWSGSRRHVAPGAADPWLGKAAGNIVRVGVFVNAPRSEILSLARAGLIDVVQLHGDEGFRFANELEEEGVPVIRALALRSVEDLDRIEESGAEGPRVLLVDAWCADAYGGGGRVGDWGLAAEAVRRFPERRIILAGGLTPENVRRAVESVGPAAVDVASGVESAPGVKAEAAVRRFVAEARAAGRGGDAGSGVRTVE